MISEKKFNKSLGRLLKSERNRLGINQEKMGKCLKIDQTSVCRVELGMQRLSVYQIILLAKKFKVPAQTIIDFAMELANEDVSNTI